MGPAQNEVPAGHEVRQVSHELGYYARVMGIGRDEAAVRVRMVYLGVAAAVVGMLSCVAGFALIPLDAKLEKGDGDATAAQFLLDAGRFFLAHGIRVERVMTDNGNCYISGDLARRC